MQENFFSAFKIYNNIKQKRMKRITKLLLAALVCCSLLTAYACCTKKGVVAGITQVPYNPVRNYFFNNDAKIPTQPKITTQKAFDRLFGAAAFMGKDGEPTKIDFAKQFVIAVVLPETDTETDIQPVRLTQTLAGLHFTYRVRRGQKMSSYMQPLLLVAVDKKYETSQVTISE